MKGYNMARPKKTITPENIAAAEAELNAIKDGTLCKRLLAIIAYAENTAEQVAKIFHVTPVSVINWASVFSKKGVYALSDAPKGHRHRKLSGQTLETVKKWIIESKDADNKRVHWTLKRVKSELERIYGIKMSIAAISNTFAVEGIVLKRPRPMHYNRDPQKAEDFKKKPRK